MRISLHISHTRRRASWALCVNPGFVLPGTGQPIGHLGDWFDPMALLAMPDGDGLKRDQLGLLVAITLVVGLAAILAILLAGEFSRHWLFRGLARAFFKVFCCIRYEGREHVPRTGALIVASNHVSWLDGFFVGCAVPRLIHFMVAREYYEPWHSNWFLRLFGLIPLDREKGQRQPFQHAKAALSEGRVVGMFPEAYMSHDGALRTFKRGIGLLAIETGAPILPVAIIGGRDVWGPHMKRPRPFQKVRVRIGEPIDPTGIDREEVVARVRDAIDRLRKGEPGCPSNEAT